MFTNAPSLTFNSVPKHPPPHFTLVHTWMPTISTENECYAKAEGIHECLQFHIRLGVFRLGGICDYPHSYFSHMLLSKVLCKLNKIIDAFLRKWNWQAFTNSIQSNFCYMLPHQIPMTNDKIQKLRWASMETGKHLWMSPSLPWEGGLYRNWGIYEWPPSHFSHMVLCQVLCANHQHWKVFIDCRYSQRFGTICKHPILIFSHMLPLQSPVGND